MGALKHPDGSPRRLASGRGSSTRSPPSPSTAEVLGLGDDEFGDPPRAQIDQLELGLLLKLGKRFPVEQFEAAVSQ